MSEDCKYISLHVHGGRSRKMLTLEIGRAHPNAIRFQQPEYAVEMVEQWLEKGWPSYKPKHELPARELLVELEEEGE